MLKMPILTGETIDEQLEENKNLAPKDKLKHFMQLASDNPEVQGLAEMMVAMRQEVAGVAMLALYDLLKRQFEKNNKNTVVVGPIDH